MVLFKFSKGGDFKGSEFVVSFSTASANDKLLLRRGIQIIPVLMYWLRSVVSCCLWPVGGLTLASVAWNQGWMGAILPQTYSGDRDYGKRHGRRGHLLISVTLLVLIIAVR